MARPIMTANSAPGDRSWSQLPSRRSARRRGQALLEPPGARVDERSLAVYEAVGQALAPEGLR